MNTLKVLFLCGLLSISFLAQAETVGTAFTYQGELKQQNAPATGTYDFQFDLYDAEVDSVALTNPIQLEDIDVQDGIFTVELDFGSEVFDGTQLWLEIAVREGESVALHTPLNPRQKLTSDPYSLGTGAKVSANEVRIAELEAQVASLVNLLNGVSRGTDPNTSQDTLTFTNMNVQVVSGSGATNGTTTGTGNLIIGYNELRNDSESPDYRDGSHMLVIGKYNNYTAESFGGMVVGRKNETSGNYSSVSGGIGNLASGFYSSVSGGAWNIASGHSSSVSGGDFNTASGSGSSVSGGSNNIADSFYATVSGGMKNTVTADAIYGVISAGFGNTASGQQSSVSGGQDNIASGGSSSVSGGQNNSANGGGASISGGHSNTASGIGASVSGGEGKTAAGARCIVGDNGVDC